MDGRSTYLAVPPPAQKRAVHQPCFHFDVYHCGQIGLHQIRNCASLFLAIQRAVGKSAGRWSGAVLWTLAGPRELNVPAIILLVESAKKTRDNQHKYLDIFGNNLSCVVEGGCG